MKSLKFLKILIIKPMKIIITTLLFLAIASALIPLDDLNFIGRTIDPLTYEFGKNIFDTTKQCKYLNTYEGPCGFSLQWYPEYNATIQSYLYTRMFDYQKLIDDERIYGVRALDFTEFPSGRFSLNSLHNADYMYYANSALMETYTERITSIGYTVGQQKFNPELIDLVNSCVDAINNNETEFASLVQTLMENFKPSYISNTLFGAKLTQNTYLDNTYARPVSEELLDLANEAASFASLFYDSGNVNKLNKYQHNVLRSDVYSNGGRYSSDSNLTSWQQSAYEYPSLLYFDLNFNLPWLDESYWSSAHHEALESIKESYSLTFAPYYAANTRYGCTDSYGENFNRGNNYDDGSCDYDYTTMSSYGSGVKYIVDNLSIKSIDYNLITHGSSCPDGYQSVTSWFKYDTDWNRGYHNTVMYVYEDCNSGLGPYAFGGLYDSNNHNPLTHDFTCPPSFWDVDGWCLGSKVPSSTYGGNYRLLNVKSNLNNNISASGPLPCFSPNYITQECRCPDNTPIAFTQKSKYADLNGTDWVLSEVTCFSKPEFIIGVNGGNLLTYTKINYRYALGNSSTTHGGGHDKHWKPVVNIFIPVVLTCACGLVCVVVGVVAYLVYRHFKRNGYDEMTDQV